MTKRDLKTIASFSTAAENNDFARVQALLTQYGKDIVNDKNPNLGDSTALIWVVWKNHLDMAQFLIRQGADIHIKTRAGLTPLMIAAQQGYDQMVRLLLEQGADIAMTNQSGHTVLQVVEAMCAAEPAEEQFPRTANVLKDFIEGRALTAALEVKRLEDQVTRMKTQTPKFTLKKNK